MSQQCSQLKSLPEKVRQFWEEKQHTLDDTLLRFSYTVLTFPSGAMSREKAGLLYLMERNLWFEDFPSTSTFSLLFQQSARYQKTLLQLPLATLEQFRLVSRTELHTTLFDQPPQTGFFQQLSRMFGATPKYLFVSGSDSVGHPFRYAFRDVENPEAWIMALSEAT